ncbi:MAG TPA: type II secretion system minor pseudopilin GspI [Candidatus Binataceae bacterium]|nr:type II secretion system minor pseudopilin GspI [Candidatus Binataceae bacterium]
MTARNYINSARAGFTLLEVLIAIAVLGIALLALLALEHQDLQSVIRGQDVSRAAMLAQALMTQAELQRFPPIGNSSGDFDRMYSGQYPNFRWTRSVEPSPVFPDLRKVEIHVRYGPRFGRDFSIVEFMHNPMPQVATPQSAAPQNPALQGSQPGGGTPAD